MEQINRIGMDTSKHIFHLHGVNDAEEVVVNKRLRRQAMLSFFEELGPTIIGIEACGSAHYWARTLGAMGHEVRLLPAQYVKPYVKRNKNDAADAAGLCEAMSRPTMRFVPVKSAEDQAALMLVGVRNRLVRNRTQVANSIRGYAAEFGLIAGKGLCRIEPLLIRIEADETLPFLARKLFAQMGQDYRALDDQIKHRDAELKAWHRQNELSRRLIAIPGVGPIGASLLAMKTVDPESFKSGRDFAAWIGLTPKDHSTASRLRLGVITRAGDEALRHVLVAGAMSVIKQAKAQHGTPSPWLVRLLERKPPKLAAIALANKTARIAWKMMVTGACYDRRHTSMSDLAQDTEAQAA